MNMQPHFAMTKVSGFHRLAVSTAWLITLVLSSQAQAQWARPELTDPRQVEMAGQIGDNFKHGLDRIGQAPYSVPFVLADVSLATNRWFTNYSGDISGRFIELASVTSAQKPEPAALAGVMDQIATYQKPDGHFGADVNWKNPADLRGQAWDVKVMPIFWGNGRLLLGLTAGASQFNNPQLLTAAKKLGDFYVNTAADIFCDPKRTNEYLQTTGYASAYVTCYFEGMEGLVKLYRLTHDKRYLDTAMRMADFHEMFDTLPIGHSHGSLSEHEALVLLYEETGKAKYLNRVVDRWNHAVKEGYVSPVGGVLEKFVASGFDRDEGCSEADWLRVTLMLWHNTGETRYLDMAERTLWNEYFGNQWADGGFGHRNMGVDAMGPFAFRNYSEEALWCCTFHGPLALNDLRSYLAVGGTDGIRYNFPIDFKAPVKVSKSQWTVQSKSLPAADGVPVRCEVTLTRQSGRGQAPLLVRIPEWAETITATSNGKELPATKVPGYLRFGSAKSGSKIEVAYHAHPYLENRRFERVALPTNLPAQLKNVVIRCGPSVLLNQSSGDIQSLSLQIKDGKLQLPTDGAVKLVTWSQLGNSTSPHGYVFDVEVK